MSIFEVVCLGMQGLIAYFCTNINNNNALFQEENNDIQVNDVVIGLNTDMNTGNEIEDLQGKKPSLEEKASFCSRLFFNWLSPMIKIGYSRPLEEYDIPILHTDNRAKDATDRFEHVWNEAYDKAMLEMNHNDKSLSSSISLARIIGKVCLYPYLKILPFNLLSIVCQFITPVLLQNLILFIGSDRPDSEGYFIICLIFVFNIVAVICVTYAQNQLYHLAFQIKASLIGMVCCP